MIVMNVTSVIFLLPSEEDEAKTFEESASGDWIKSKTSSSITFSLTTNNFVNVKLRKSKGDLF